MKKESCIFCGIASGEVPSSTLYEDNLFRVILDLGPATKGHALIVSKEHMENLYELSDEAAENVFVLAKKMAVRMKDKLACDGFNIIQNNGETAGQTISHFHLHLLPRYEGDGQDLVLRKGSPKPEELDAVRNQIIG